MIKWKTINDYPNYAVSNAGDVMNLITGKTLKQETTHKGYKRVTLSNGRKRQHLRVHRLVANAFIPNSDSSKMLINHINEDKSNNTVENLEWCSNSDNLRHNMVNKRKGNSHYFDLINNYDYNLSVSENHKRLNAMGINIHYTTVQRFKNDLKTTLNKTDLGN